MSYYNVKPIQLELTPSVVLSRIIRLAVLSVLLVLLFLPLQPALKILLACLSILMAVRAFRRHVALQQPDAVVHLCLHPESGLLVRQRDGQECQALVQADSFVAAWLTVLNLRSVESGQRYTLLLLPDNVAADGFRQLRVWLRWRREMSVADRQASG